MRSDVVSESGLTIRCCVRIGAAGVHHGMSAEAEWWYVLLCEEARHDSTVQPNSDTRKLKDRLKLVSKFGYAKVSALADNGDNGKEIPAKTLPAKTLPAPCAC